MANHGHDRKTGRFISRARSRVQNIQEIGDLPDHEYAIDEAAMAIFEAGIALAIKDGWQPPPEVEQATAADTIAAEARP